MATQTIARGATTLGSPNDGDTVLILGGNATVTTNLDWSGVNTLAICEVSNEFSGQFGSSSGPLKANFSTRLVYAAQAGDMYVASDGAASDVSALVQVTGGGHLHFQTIGTFTRAEICSGQMTVATACIVTTLSIAGGSVTLLDDSSTDPTTVNMWPSGGMLVTERGGTTFNHAGGHMLIRAGTNTITTLNVYAPGVQLVESGTITTLNPYGGIPDVRQLTRALTITNTNMNMKLPGAQAFLDHPLITFTNPATRYITDGRY